MLVLEVLFVLPLPFVLTFHALVESPTFGDRSHQLAEITGYTPGCMVEQQTRPLRLRPDPNTKRIFREYLLFTAQDSGDRLLNECRLLFEPVALLFFY